MHSAHGYRDSVATRSQLSQAVRPWNLHSTTAKRHVLEFRFRNPPIRSAIPIKFTKNTKVEFFKERGSLILQRHDKGTVVSMLSTGRQDLVAILHEIVNERSFRSWVTFGARITNGTHRQGYRWMGIPVLRFGLLCLALDWVHGGLD